MARVTCGFAETCCGASVIVVMVAKRIAGINGEEGYQSSLVKKVAVVIMEKS